MATTTHPTLDRPLPRSARRYNWRAVPSQLWELAWSLLTLFFVTFPILLMFYTAFRQSLDVYSDRFFSPLTLQNFQTIFVGEFSVVTEFFTSLFISTVTVAIAVPCAVAAA
jgi:ABC-type glycerol-3-phosphate transport system permease component